MDNIRSKVLEGKIVLVGISVGVVVMGYYMIVGGGSGLFFNRFLVDIIKGLVILLDLIVD